MAKPRSESGASRLLDHRIERLMADIQREPFWLALSAEDRDPQFATRLMKEVYLEIVWYQPDVIEATIAAIGQFPRSVAAKRIQSMLHHQADEWDHGEMALRDYVALGGSEAFARESRPSPSALAVASYWRMLAHKRDPFAYLGGLYLFEGLTPLISAQTRPLLEASGMTRSSLEYIEFHAEEDIKHQNLVRFLIDDLIEAYPQAMPSLIHGIDCFEYVYPIPCWRSAYSRALAGGSEALYQGEGYATTGLPDHAAWRVSRQPLPAGPTP